MARTSRFAEGLRHPDDNDRGLLDLGDAPPPPRPDRSIVRRADPDRQVMKNLSFVVPLPVWRTLRVAAARQGIPISVLCRELMEPDLSQLLRQYADDPETAA
jgi:hypothetical protein